MKENLTAPADNASALQIKGLKAVLKKLKDADPSKEELIANIAVQTKGIHGDFQVRLRDADSEDYRNAGRRAK